MPKSWIRKVARKGARMAKKRYTTKKGGVRIGKIAKDVAWLKGVLNPEKKNFTFNNTANNLVGCFNGNTVGGGYFSLDITPTPSQGVTETGRSGNSIKLHSSYIQLQFSQMSACVQPIRFRVILLAIKGIPYSSASTYPTVLFNANPFLSGFAVYDYNSTYEQSFLPNQRIICDRKYLLPANEAGTQTMIKDVKIPLRYKNHHIKYLADGSTTVTHGQIYMIVVADNGNCSTSTAVTGQTNAIYTAINTGMKLNYNIIHYYYDN